MVRYDCTYLIEDDGFAVHGCSRDGDFGRTHDCRGCRFYEPVTVIELPDGLDEDDIPF